MPNCSEESLKEAIDAASAVAETHARATLGFKHGLAKHGLYRTNGPAWMYHPNNKLESVVYNEVKTLVERVYEEGFEAGMRVKDASGGGRTRKHKNKGRRTRSSRHF